MSSPKTLEDWKKEAESAADEDTAELMSRLYDMGCEWYGFDWLAVAQRMRCACFKGTPINELTDKDKEKARALISEEREVARRMRELAEMEL